MNIDENLMDSTMEECAILYCSEKLSLPTYSRCCYCWECNKGWYTILYEASCKLEALNLLYYPKFKVRIQADQIKEKFGHLCFYFSVVCDDIEHVNEQEVIITAMNSWAEEIANWARSECDKTCEECGMQIGTEWSPRCETEGYIKYICDKCATKMKTFYYKNGAKWYEDHMVMTKEEVDEVQKQLGKNIIQKL